MSSGNRLPDLALTLNSIDAEPVLRDVTFKVEAGQKVAICGRTGRYVPYVQLPSVTELTPTVANHLFCSVYSVF